MFDKERASLEEVQKRAELLIIENAEAEARRRAEDEAQRRAIDQEQAVRLAEVLARAERAEAMLSRMESKMELMMNAMFAGAPRSSTVTGMGFCWSRSISSCVLNSPVPGPSIVQAVSGPEEEGHDRLIIHRILIRDTDFSRSRQTSRSSQGGCLRRR